MYLDKLVSFLLNFLIPNTCLFYLELYFIINLLQLKIKKHHYIIYIVAMYIVTSLEVILQFPFMISTAVEFLVLLLFIHILLKCNLIHATISTILAITIMQVVNDIFMSSSKLIVRLINCSSLNYTYFNFVFAILSIIALYFIYRQVIKMIGQNNIRLNKNILILLCPMILILILVQYFMFGYASEGNYIIGNIEAVIIRIIIFLCLIFSIYAYSRIETSFNVDLQNALLLLQTNELKSYLQEIRTRYEETKSFRHDIKSHLIVIRELLTNNETSKALEYVEKLDQSSDSITMIAKTGNTVLDALLSSKLGNAKQLGANINCTVKVPTNCIIDDMDLCIVFSNALNNSLNALVNVPENKRFIDIATTEKGSFFMVDIKNSIASTESRNVKFGIGLNNITNVAKKYGGTAIIEQDNESFRINILFINSQQ